MCEYINLGFLTINSYIFFIIIGMISYVIVTLIMLEKKLKLPSKITNKIMLLSIVFFFILYISAFVMNSLFHSIESRRIILGGITWLGGVIISFPAMILLMYKFIPELRTNILKTFSFLIPGIVLAHAFGRIGCFMAGCCYGSITDSFIGISFPPGSLAALQYPGINGYSLKVVPTQLIEALFDIFLFALMLFFTRKNYNNNYEFYGITYGTFRFIIEFFRGDNRGSTGIILTPSQLMSLILIVTVVLVYLIKRKKIFVNRIKKIEKNNKEFLCDDFQKSNLIYKIYLMYKKNEIKYDEFLKIKNLILNKEV